MDSIPNMFSKCKVQFFSSMLLLHYFIVSSNVVQCSGSKASQQMMRHKSLRVDHSGRIPMCVEGSPGLPQKAENTHVSTNTHCEFVQIL